MFFEASKQLKQQLINSGTLISANPLKGIKLLFFVKVERRVLLILFDGVRFDALDYVVRQNMVPFIKQIIHNGDIRKGHAGPATSISYSAPGWRTITGFTSDHGMIDNSFKIIRDDRKTFFEKLSLVKLYPLSIFL